MPGVGVGVLIFNDEGKVLLILRNTDPKKAQSDMHLEGTWTLPAGKVKLGETMINAAKRKVKEEVNLSVDHLEIVSIEDDINEYAHYVTIGLLAKTFNGDVDLGLSEEHIECKWFDIKKLPENLCEPSKKIIENYLKK